MCDIILLIFDTEDMCMADFLNEMRTMAAEQSSINFDSIAAELYKGQVTQLVTIMKDQIRNQVKNRNPNQSFHGMHFDDKAVFHFSDNKSVLPRMYPPKEGSYYKVYRDTGYGYSYVHLNELYELKKESTFLK